MWPKKKCFNYAALHVSQRASTHTDVVVVEINIPLCFCLDVALPTFSRLCRLKNCEIVAPPFFSNNTAIKFNLQTFSKIVLKFFLSFL